MPRRRDASPVRDVVRRVSGGIELLPGSLMVAEFEEAADRVLHVERSYDARLRGRRRPDARSPGAVGDGER